MQCSSIKMSSMPSQSLLDGLIPKVRTLCDVPYVFQAHPFFFSAFSLSSHSVLNRCYPQHHHHLSHTLIPACVLESRWLLLKGMSLLDSWSFDEPVEELSASSFRKTPGYTSSQSPFHHVSLCCLGATH